MSRALNVAATEAKLSALCAELKIGISVLEPLQSGGTRIVLNNSDDAAALRIRLKKELIDGPVVRSASHVARQVISYL